MLLIDAIGVRNFLILILIWICNVELHSGIVQLPWWTSQFTEGCALAVILGFAIKAGVSRAALRLPYQATISGLVLCLFVSCLLGVWNLGDILVGVLMMGCVAAALAAITRGHVGVGCLTLLMAGLTDVLWIEFWP